MTLKEITKKNLKEIKKKWMNLQKKPNVFAYTLNVTNSKYLSDKKTFYLELNEERSSLRRTPQTITSLNPQFDEDEFNFRKIDPLEVMLKIAYGDDEIAMIINKSPLTKYHTLICPNVDAGLAQRITPISLKFSVNFVKHMNDDNFRIGYNSPGALASVNHLHLHLVHIPTNLYIDNCELEHVSNNYIYRLSKDMPTEAICFLIDKKDTDEILNKKIIQIYDFLIWLCEQNYPHNLFITMGRKGKFKKQLKVFVFARAEYCIVKNLQEFNIGFSELSGYVPVGGRKLFDTLTDEHVITKIVEETGDIYEHIYSYLTNSFDGDDQLPATTTVTSTNSSEIALETTNMQSDSLIEDS